MKKATDMGRKKGRGEEKRAEGGKKGRERGGGGVYLTLIMFPSV